jgi:DNA polymerase-1
MAASAGIEIYIQNRMFGMEPERAMSKNLRSADQLKKILRSLGFLVPDTKKETIFGLQGKHEFIDNLINYKKLRKLYDAYIIPTFDLVDSDGRIRPSFGIVKTGRTNCRNPNLQQLPNFNKQFPELNYRAIFISSNDSKLVGGDYLGQELRCLGVVSGDETIIKSFIDGFDLHLVTANGLFNLSLDSESLRDGTEQHNKAIKQYKQERYRAKNGVNFPIVYGSSEYGISHHMGVSVEEAKEWRRKFFELYPRVKEAMNETKKELEENLEVSTMMGRKRRFPNYRILPNYSKGKTPSKSRCVRQAFNSKIQGFSADQVKIAAALSRKAGLKILLIVHDEIVIESSEPSRDARVLKQCMENAVQLSIPFVADIKIGNCYSELK